MRGTYSLCLLPPWCPFNVVVDLVGVSSLGRFIKNGSLVWEWGSDSFPLIEPINGRWLLPGGVGRSERIIVISGPYFYIFSDIPINKLAQIERIFGASRKAMSVPYLRRGCGLWLGKEASKSKDSPAPAPRVLTMVGV